MRQSTGDIFSTKPCDAVVITTNGFVKRNGDAVMGRGCAKQASQKWPELPSILGRKINDLGNHVHYLMTDRATGKHLVSFPVKPAWMIPETHDDIEQYVVKHWKNQAKIGQPVPGFALKAMPDLILNSATELVELTQENQWEDVICPQFGCGAGELRWDEISKLLENVLDDRFIAMTYASSPTAVSVNS